MDSTNVSAIILAAGESKRLQTNKLLLMYRGKPLIEHVMHLVRSFDFHEVLLVVSEENLLELQRFEYESVNGHRKRVQIPEDFKILVNQHINRGLSHSVVFSTEVASGEAYLFLTVDQPLLTSNLINEILSSGNTRNIVFPMKQGKPCSPTFFGREFRTDLLHVKGQTGGSSIRDLYTFAHIKIPVENETQLLDIDTLEDYSILRGIL